MNQNITIFKNIKSIEAPFHRPLSVVLNRIKNGTSKEIINKIRLERRKDARQELKKGLPAICFSGEFTKRNDTSLVQHSGIICLDFDGYETKKELQNDKDRMTKDKYVLSVFISPSGNGIKVLVKIPFDVDNHINYFNSLNNYFSSPRFDKTSRNVSRVCYESYDPLIYTNDESELWDRIDEPEYKEVVTKLDAPTIPITDENKIVEILTKWWTKKYPMIEGQRNHNAYVLASAFNDYGINHSLASYVLGQYSNNDFPMSEINQTINSAYSQLANFGTKYYEDEDRVNQIKNKLKRGASKKEIRDELKSTELDSDTIDAVIAKVESDNEKQTFWSKNDKGVIKIEHIQFKSFLEDNGFYKFCPEGSKNYVFVRVSNNLIDHANENDIKDFVLTYLLDVEDLSIYNYFADCVRYFREEFLTLLSTIDAYFISDTKDEAYLYFTNCALRITKNGKEVIDYLDLGGYIWKDQVIDRPFIEDKDFDCDYRVFISNICNSDSNRIDTMESTIGFLMHGYKNFSKSPAVILNDEVISDNPEGGTGKGLFMNALSQMKKLVIIDGKHFNFEKSFPYQLVSADTQILCFDDVKKHFDFEKLFSIITEGLTLEKKNKDAIKIPFGKSPKVAITTNYAIKGAGNSFARRKWEIELHQHYNGNNTPLDEFGRHFWAEWDTDEWTKFDNYMINCLSSYLNTGLVKSKFINLRIRQLSAETSYEFIEWVGLVKETSNNIRFGARLYKQSLYYDFIEENPDYGPKSKFTISRNKFYNWLDAYSKYLSKNINDGRDNVGKWIMFEEKEN
tara:strand:- start:468 stop:2849 length:2382 start_codon:yes stop_codon:yes gene_type:complete